MEKLYRTCPNCDSLVKKDICLNCGYAFEDSTPSDGVTSSITGLNPDVPNSFLTSISSLRDSADVQGGAAPDAPRKSRLTLKRIIWPVFLSLLLAVIVGEFYYQFFYAQKKYISPIVSVASDPLPAVEGLEIDAGSLESNVNEKALDLKVDLVEGNFEKVNFAVFAPPDSQLFLHLFDIRKVAGIFFVENLISDVEKSLFFKKDDIDVYFSKDFAIIFSDSDLKTWGAVFEVLDKPFLDKTLAKFKIQKEKKGFKYKDYDIGFVEVDKKYFLIVATSKEFLDELKEASEGNLTNLSSDVKFVQAKGSLPQIGQAYVYKGDSLDAWNIFSDFVSAQFSYVGLDKILKSFETSALVFHSKDDKVFVTENSE